MMYASYEHHQEQEERSWEEELELPLAVKQFVRRLLQQSGPGWASAAQCEQELEQLLASLTE
jgi:serine/threonine-protein kinase